MALFSFSGKNKNTPEPAQPPAPPKLQSPPTPASPPLPPATPPPTPGGPAAPALGRAVSAATRGVTQPIVMPKRGPGAAPVRSTQRIVIPGGLTPAPEAAAPQFHTSTVQLPAAMILRVLPQSALNGTLADLERSPAGQQKLAVPLSMILPQLPTGKIEVPFQDLANLMPAELLASKDRLAPYLSNLVHLPLMEVVMLIPPDMLALRSDQKKVDAAVEGMGDPFKLEDLQKAAAAAAAAQNAPPAPGLTETAGNPLAHSMTSTAPMPGGRKGPATPPPPPVRPSSPPQTPTQAPAQSRITTPPPTPTAPPMPTSTPSSPPMPPGPRRPSLPDSAVARPTISLPMVKGPTSSRTTPPAAPHSAPAPQPTLPPQPAPQMRTPTPPPAPVVPPPEPEPEYEEPAYTEAPAPAPVQEAPAPAPKPAGPLNLNSCQADQLAQIPGISAEVAQSIVAYRTKIGKFSKLADLLDVPLMTRGIYTLLTGDESQPSTINDLLGFPTEQTLTLKDIVERISCWPDVTGAVLGQSNGLPIVAHLSPKVKFGKDAIVAFAPRMFEALNKSYSEISGAQTDELIIPSQDTSFHILRKGNLYLIILARTPQMPSRHLQVARLVLASLNYK